MRSAKEEKTREIFDAVARGSSLDRSLTLVADQVAADLSAPTCKIWVVKRGDICEHCPLASICTNRQICMHLEATSGAAIDKEYPRIPISLFEPSLLSHGGTRGFGAGGADKLFGLQHGAPHDENDDSYALHPLRGISGTVGLIGVFNHRPIEPDELERLAELSSAAVAAIRVAELQSRYDSAKSRLDRESSASAEREHEYENTIAELTYSVSQLQVERESLQRTIDDARTRADKFEIESRQLRERGEAMTAMQHESGRAYSEMVAQIEGERRQVEEENSWLKGRLATLEQTVSDLNRLREELIAEVQRRAREIDEQKSDREAKQVEFNSARDLIARLEQRVSLLEEANAGLRDHNAAITESVDDIGRSLRIAEDARARLEQTRVTLEEKIAEMADEMERLELENNRILGDNDQLVTETERLRTELSELQTSIDRFSEEHDVLASQNRELNERSAGSNVRIAALEKELTQSKAAAGKNIEDLQRGLEKAKADSDERIAELEHRNSELKETALLAQELAQKLGQSDQRIREFEDETASLQNANSQLEAAVHQFESVTTRLEETATKLRDRVEASEKARSELEQRNRILLEQNRRIGFEGQAKARFLANMSHELRTPMNAIIGFTSLLLEDRSLQLTDRHRRSLERVSRNARDLLELINNVLDLSKIEAGRMDVLAEPAEARDLIERALAVAEPLKGSRPIKLSLDIAGDLPTLRTDRTKVQQILINLLSNAIKFTEEGEVKVSASRAHAGDGGDFIRLTVSDTGTGIAEADISKLFEEFRQVGQSRGSRSGTGLGLAITKRLVELLGGEISVSSRLGEGSMFVVTLPAQIEGRIAPSVEVPVADPDRTALVVNGDPASLFLTKKYLSESGYSVVATDDSRRAIDIVRMAHPGLITVDLDATDNALDFIEQIASHDKAAKVVIFSSDPANEKSAFAAGGHVFLRKPVERDVLMQAIARVDSSETGRVLVVDDDADALDLVVAMLEDTGYEIQTAATGREALDQIAKVRPDTIILDLMLPEMDGFEVVHRLSLNSDWRNIPVILLTARDLSHEERRALDIGTMRIIQKGNFNRDELLAELRAFMGSSLEPIAPPESGKVTPVLP